MTAQLSPAPVFSSRDNFGFPLVDGKLFTYAAGTTTPQATYVDSTQTTQNTNPVVLNYRGEAFVWLNPLLAYKFVLQDAFGNQIWTEDNIQGAIGVASNITPSITNTFTLGTPTSPGYASSYTTCCPFRTPRKQFGTSSRASAACRISWVVESYSRTSRAISNSLIRT